MAVLGKNRQRSIFLILVIGMALFAFVISGVFDANSSNAGPSDPIGLINDEEVDLTFFRQLVEQTERGYSYSTLQSVNLVWNQTLQNTIFKQQFDVLGIDAGKDQLEQILSTDEAIVTNPSFQNEAGFFDFGVFSDFIAQMKVENPVAYENWKLQEQSIIDVAKQRIYLDLIQSSTGMTEAEAKSDYHFENDNVNLEYIQIPYESIADSLIEVSDAEIKNYIKNHEAEFKKEASRSIQYVAFEEIPTEDDLSAIELRLEALKKDRIAYNDVSKLTDTLEGLQTTKNISDFVEQYSEVPFDSVYKAKGELNNEYADILFGLAPGEVFGPYKDGNDFKISRLIDVKKDASLRASHILIVYKGATRAAERITRSKEEAQSEANRIYALARKSNADFEMLARENSDDPTRTKGGDLGFFREGDMVEEFYNFVNTNAVNKVGIVETEFGFHIIKVTDKDNLALIADVVAAAVPSDNTSNETFRKATQFEMDSNESDFIKVAEGKNYSVRPVKQITALEENLPGLIQQRAIVKWAFDNDTSVGDIQRFSLNGGGYVVVQLTDKIKEGLADVATVGNQVRRTITNEKKATMITAKYKGKSTLEELAETEDLIIETASAVNQKNPTLVGAGNEPYVVGAAFMLDEGATSDLINGQRGVYMIKVIQKTIAEDLEDYSAYANAMRQSAAQTLIENIYKALESVSDIKDNRALYY